MNLLHSKAIIANKEVRNLELDQALPQLMHSKEAIKELFQSVAGQFLLEYLLATADRIRDDFMEKETSTDIDKAYLRGQLQVINDIVGLVAFMNSFKEAKR